MLAIRGDTAAEYKMGSRGEVEVRESEVRSRVYAYVSPAQLNLGDFNLTPSQPPFVAPCSSPPLTATPNINVHQD